MIVEQELLELKARVNQLEAEMRRLTNGKPPLRPKPGPIQSHDEIVAWLMAQGLIRPPTPEELQQAAEWDNLPEEEKKAHILAMHSLALDPMLSEIITENRR